MKKGDVVELKSDSSLSMTVTDVSDMEVRCTWFHDGVVRTAVFPIEVLTISHYNPD